MPPNNKNREMSTLMDTLEVPITYMVVYVVVSG